MQANDEAARQIAQVPGLRWKIWTSNEAAGEAGAVYLFDDEASLEAYWQRMLPMLQSVPVISDISAKRFEVVDELNAITRAPV